MRSIVFTVLFIAGPALAQSPNWMRSDERPVWLSEDGTVNQQALDPELDELFSDGAVTPTFDPSDETMDMGALPEICARWPHLDICQDFLSNREEITE